MIINNTSPSDKALQSNLQEISGTNGKAINSTQWSQHFLLFVARLNKKNSEYFHVLNREAV